jgi:methionyl-tRNA formyltransferase
VRIVFFGTPELAVPTLDALHHHHEVAAVVCRPDKPQGRSSKLVPPPVKGWALEHGVPVEQPVKLNDGAFERWLRAQRPELCVLVAYGRILKEPILDVPRHGFLNLHPSLLPKYRGPSPIQAAVLHGDEKTGLTVIRLSMETDAGDILVQDVIDIMPEDTTASLTERLAPLGANVMLRAVGLVEDEEAVFTPQDHERASYTSMLRKEDGAIHWAWPAARIHNLVRAAIPWPIAYCRYERQTMRVLKTRVLDVPSTAPPGTISEVGRDAFTVATGDGDLEVLEVQMPGKRAMAVGAFLRGHKLAAGDRLEDG